MRYVIFTVSIILFVIGGVGWGISVVVPIVLTKLKKRKEKLNS